MSITWIKDDDAYIHLLLTTIRAVAETDGMYSDDKRSLLRELGILLHLQNKPRAIVSMDVRGGQTE